MHGLKSCGLTNKYGCGNDKYGKVRLTPFFQALTGSVRISDDSGEATVDVGGPLTTKQVVSISEFAHASGDKFHWEMFDASNVSRASGRTVQGLFQACREYGYMPDQQHQQATASVHRFAQPLPDNPPPDDEEPEESEVERLLNTMQRQWGTNYDVRSNHTKRHWVWPDGKFSNPFPRRRLTADYDFAHNETIERGLKSSGLHNKYEYYKDDEDIVPFFQSFTGSIRVSDDHRDAIVEIGGRLTKRQETAIKEYAYTVRDRFHWCVYDTNGKLRDEGFDLQELFNICAELGYMPYQQMRAAGTSIHGFVHGFLKGTRN